MTKTQREKKVNKNEMLFFNTWSIINELNKFYFRKDSMVCVELLSLSFAAIRFYALYRMHFELYFKPTHTSTVEIYRSQCVVYRLFSYSCLYCRRRRSCRCYINYFAFSHMFWMRQTSHKRTLKCVCRVHSPFAYIISMYACAHWLR